MSGPPYLSFQVSSSWSLRQCSATMSGGRFEKPPLFSLATFGDNKRMGRSVIVVYRPKPGMESALEAAVRKHVAVLAEQGLVTDRAPFVMRAASGAIVEVFEWRSAEAIASAHSNPAVQALWAEFGAACEYAPLVSLPEAQNLFAEFDTVEL